MKNILLTGATGFLGHHVLEQLIHERHRIIAPIREISVDQKSSNLSRAEVLIGDFYDEKMLKNYSSFSIDTIIHLAAIRGEGKSPWSDYQRVNVSGTERLLNFALTQNVKLFVYCSTVGVYGTIPKTLPADIQTELNPDNFYHQSKSEAEKLVIDKFQGKIPYVILRPTITYGPHDNGFLAKLIDLIRKRKFPLIKKNIKIHLLNVQTISEYISLLTRENFSHQIIVNLADRELVQFDELVNLIYAYFHGHNYPNFLKVPKWAFSVGKFGCEILNLKKIKISLQLISESWFYDVNKLWENYPLKSKDTLNAISELLYKEYPKQF